MLCTYKCYAMYLQMLCYVGESSGWFPFQPIRVFLVDQYSLYECLYFVQIYYSKWKDTIDIQKEIGPFLLVHEFVEVWDYRGYTFYRGLHC